MMTDAFLRSTSLVPLDDAPMTTSGKFFDMEQFGGTNQSDSADQVFPLDRWVSLVVTTTFNECTTMQFDLVTDDAVTFDTGPTRLYVGPAIAVGTLVAGYTIFNINLGGQILDRYISFDNTKGGSTETTGKVELILAGPPIIALNNQVFPT